MQKIWCILCDEKRNVLKIGPHNVCRRCLVVCVDLVFDRLGGALLAEQERRMDGQP